MRAIQDGFDLERELFSPQIAVISAGSQILLFVLLNKAVAGYGKYGDTRAVAPVFFRLPFNLRKKIGLVCVSGRLRFVGLVRPTNRCWCGIWGARFGLCGMCGSPGVDVGGPRRAARPALNLY